jgi:hypothetical protein
MSEPLIAFDQVTTQRIIRAVKPAQIRRVRRHLHENSITCIGLSKGTELVEVYDAVTNRGRL